MARLLDVASPLLYPEATDDAVDKAVGFANNLRNHIAVHYGLHAAQNLPTLNRDGSVNPSNMSVVDLLHYHTYGDYRLVMAPDASASAPEFLKTNIDTTVLRYKTGEPQGVSSVRTMSDLNYLSTNLANEKFDLLNGVTGDRGMELAETEWFVRELAFGSSAMKFHLPSLGTMAVANYTHTNVNEKISKALAESLEQMMEAVDYNKRLLPDALRAPFDADAIYGAGHCQDESLQKNPLIFHIAKAITLNQEYIELQSNYNEVLTPAVVNGLAKSAYKKSDYFSAASFFAKELMKMTSALFVPGILVTFKSGGGGAKTIAAAAPGYPEVVDGNMALADAEALLLSESYVIAGSRRVGKNNLYDIRVETEYGEEFVITDVDEKELQVTAGDFEDDLIIEEARKAGKKGPKKFTHPSILVFHRIALDVIFSIEALLAVCAVPSKYFLISPTVNIQLKKEQAAKHYPNMVGHIGEVIPLNPKKPPYDKNQIDKSLATLELLAEVRLQHTVANIANMDKIVTDSRTMEEFYRQDLREAEVKWLASALTEEGKVIYEKKEIPNLLAQMQYRVKGVGDSVDLTEASVKPTSVFYQIDSPILKDVIMKYDEEFIKFTVQNAFVPKPKKKKKGGGGGGGGGSKKGEGGARIAELASAVWGSIERRSSEIVNRPGVKPHLLFANLFRNMERLSLGSMYIRDNFPPKWVGTNTITLLQSAPEVLGEELDTKFYSDCMDEYIRHLKLIYKSNATVAIRILTTITETIVQSETDVQTLRDSFLARIKSQASKPQIKGTSIVFDAYRTVIAVMRSEIDVPLRYREEYVANKLDEEQKMRIKDTFTSSGVPIVLPKDHPEFEEKEVEVDEESALYGLPNPFNMPVPPYYPRPGETLNKSNPKVVRYIESIVGDPLDPKWPTNAIHIKAGIGGLTDAESLELKKRLLAPYTSFTVLPIDWKGSEQIWDGRERRDDRAHPSVVAHFRETLGVPFEVQYKGLTFPLQIIPSSNLTDYSSIIYKKYLTNKYEPTNYVYTPASGVFKNPSTLKFIEPVMGGMTFVPEEGTFSESLFTTPLTKEVKGGLEFEKIDSSMDALSKSGTMVFGGDISELKRFLKEDSRGVLSFSGEEMAAVPEEVPEVVEPMRYTIDDGGEEKGFVADTVLHESMSAKEQLPAIQRWQTNEHLESLVENTANIAGEINAASVDVDHLAQSVDNMNSKMGLLSQQVDGAADSFESAAQSFERASENFGAASQAYERATEELAKIPEALKEGLSQTLDRLLAEAPPVLENIDGMMGGEIDDKVFEEMEEHHEKVKGATEGSPVELIREYAELVFETLPSLFKKAGKRFNYKKFEDLKPLVEEDENADLVAAAIPSNNWSLNQAVNWTRNSFVTALTHITRDEKVDKDMLKKSDRLDFAWRQRCIAAMEEAKAGRPFIHLLGITPAD